MTTKTSDAEPRKPIPLIAPLKGQITKALAAGNVRRAARLRKALAQAEADLRDLCARPPARKAE
jgi:hypothetical protein